MTYTAANRVELTGNLVDAPRLHTKEDGFSFVTVSLVTNERYVVGNRECTHTEWHHLIFNKESARQALALLDKGDFVHVEGRLRHAKRCDETTGFQYVTSAIKVLRFRLLKRKKAKKAENVASSQTESSLDEASMDFPIEEKVDSLSEEMDSVETPSVLPRETIDALKAKCREKAANNNLI